MLRRQETILILKIYNDETANFCYIKILSHSGCETVRLGQAMSKNKNSHILQPFCLLEVELIKTSKNWILSEISNYKLLLQPKLFNDYEKLSNLQKLLNSRIENGQETDILPALIEKLNNAELTKLNPESFDNFVLTKLGFVDALDVGNKDKVSSSISSNHL